MLDSHQGMVFVSARLVSIQVSFLPCLRQRSCHADANSRGRFQSLCLKSRNPPHRLPFQWSLSNPPPPPLKLSRVLEKTSFTDEVHFAPAGIGGLFNYLQSFIHPNWCRILSIHSRVNDLFQACCHPLSADKRHETKGYESGVLDPGVTWLPRKLPFPMSLG